MQRFHNPRALRPPAARAGGKRNHRNFRIAESSHSQFAQVLYGARRSAFPTLKSTEVGHVVGTHILDDRVGLQPILSQSDASVSQVGTDLFVLDAVETMVFQQVFQGFADRQFLFSPRQHDIEERLNHSA
jgi:hypothetical protein